MTLDSDDRVTLRFAPCPTVAPGPGLAILPGLRPPVPGIGATIGGYRILGVLGRGGMGVVFRAVQVALSRQVALKVLLRATGEEREHRLRMEREVRIHTALIHPNLVRVYDASMEDGVPFIAMELVEGRNLADRIGRFGALPLGETVDLARSIASAISYLHGVRIIHRDIKPANILGSGEWSFKLADLGLSRHLDSARLTRSGKALGTLQFLAPEVIVGEKADCSADIYSLGVTVYLALTGRLPHEESTRGSLMASIVNVVPVPVKKLVPQVPGPLSTLVMAMLAKDRRHRPPAARVVNLLDCLWSRPPGAGRDRLRHSSRIRTLRIMRKARSGPVPRPGVWARPRPRWLMIGLALVAGWVCGVAICLSVSWRRSLALRPRSVPVGLHQGAELDDVDRLAHVGIASDGEEPRAILRLGERRDGDHRDV